MSDYYGRRQDLGRVGQRSYASTGLSRPQRLAITIGVAAAIVLGIGISIGFAWGRASAPEPKAQPVAPVVQETTLPAGVFEETTETADPDDLVFEADESADETETVDEKPPPRPKQTSPNDGAVINAARVYLRWTEVEDDSDEPVTYAFEIQDRLSSGSYGNRQVIGKLKDNQYSARVLYVKRRWRVWAVDAAGNKSDKTGWHYYIHKARPKPAPAPEPKESDETT